MQAGDWKERMCLIASAIALLKSLVSRLQPSPIVVRGHQGIVMSCKPLDG
jgi:hypothetical protein